MDRSLPYKVEPLITHSWRQHNTSDFLPSKGVH